MIGIPNSAGLLMETWNELQFLTLRHTILKKYTLPGGYFRLTPSWRTSETIKAIIFCVEPTIFAFTNPLRRSFAVIWRACVWFQGQSPTHTLANGNSFLCMHCCPHQGWSHPIQELLKGHGGIAIMKHVISTAISPMPIDRIDICNGDRPPEPR